jgi:hypothetical protein
MATHIEKMATHIENMATQSTIQMDRIEASQANLSNAIENMAWGITNRFDAMNID